MTNRLAAEASAYLRSAAHQPIHWYPWGAEAFAAAREADRPVLLDIGAVWCHWCHVMDRESYEDAALAEFLNANFVCVKVDRDERPDVDARYQRAIQAISRQGGWPLTGFLTADGEVFYGGTYFPPRGQHGRPSFRMVLDSVLDSYRSRREQVHEQAGAVRRVIQEDLNDAKPGPVSPALLERAEEWMARAFDPANGGFGSQPKFPHPQAVAVLLNRWHDTPTARVRRIVDATLLGMARGGIHDHLGGGFHRYSVDARWIVPHFEKMAYDNSELLRVYADAYALFGTEEYGDVARGIVRWVREVLAHEQGGYGASQDADVGLDDDGDYFTWSRDEASAILSGAELDVAAARFDIGTAGEMHHDPSRNVLFVAMAVDGIARLQGRSLDETQALLDSAIAKLRAARAQRTAPVIDLTRYTNWNAMLASALLHAAPILDDAWAREHALRTLQRLRDESAEPDALAHTPGGVRGLLEDQATTAAAALDAYEATGDRAWLAWSEALLDRVWRDYHDDEGGGLFDVARDRAGEGLLPTRAKPVQDTPTPSANGVAAAALARLHAHTGDPRWKERADDILRAFAGGVGDLGLYAATYLLAADWALHPATHLTVVGTDAEAERMHGRALATFAPRRLVQRVASADVDTDAERALPEAILAMARAAGNGTRGYLCVGTACRAPAAGADAWSATLAELTAAARERAAPDAETAARA